MFSFVSFFLSFCSQCGKFLEASRTHELTKSEESRVDEEEMMNKLKNNSAQRLYHWYFTFIEIQIDL